MKKFSLKFYLMVFVFSLLFSNVASSSSNVFFNLPARASISINSGNNTFGEGDAIIPLWGNANQSLFGDIAGKYGDDNEWLLSAGLGSRQIFLNDTILGAYLFDDYNKTSNTNYFNVFNPGIEVMTNEWDGHLNGYLPVGVKNKILATYTGAQLGMPTTTFFVGHTQYDVLFNSIEEVGPGTDVEIGRTFSSFNRLRVFAGGYYFNPKYTTNMSGLEAGVEMPLQYKWATAEVRDSYDNVNHNTFILTLRFNFGGLDKTGEPNIHDRMDDWIPRHLSTLQNGNGIPSQTQIVNTGNAAVVLNNIWFFNPNVNVLFLAPSATLKSTSSITLQSCTFEHPCTDLSQTQIDEINSLAPRANFFLSPGTYNNSSQTLAYSMHNGQSIYGRTSNFQQLATGNNRPLLNNSLFLEGNNNVYNLRIIGHSIRNLETGGAATPFQVGILNRSFSTGTVNIYNTDASSTSSVNNVVGIANNSNVSSMNIYNGNYSSTMTNVAGGVGVGAGNLRSGKLNIYNSSISTTVTDISNNSSLAFGFVNNEAGPVIISNSTISTNLTHGGLAGGVLNNSTLGLGLGTITMTGSTVTVNGNDASLVAGIFNQANNVGGISANINIDSSTISATSNNNGGGVAASVTTGGTGIVSISHSTLNATGDSGTISGIVVQDATATVNFQNTTIAINTSGTATGTPTTNAGTLNNNGGNQCFQNGAPVPC